MSCGGRKVAPDTANTAQCPACRAKTSTPLWPETPPRKFQLVQCTSCKLIYTVPQLDSDEMRSYYPDQYYGRSNVRFNWIFERLVTWFRKRRALKITQYSRPGRALDVGCGRGHILAFLQSWGWTVAGVELNENAVKHARDELELPVFIGHFDPDQFPADHFDLVIFWHVLEHLSDIRQALSGAARILRPGGLLVIAVPNIASWQARLTRNHWFHLDLPRHYVHFTEDRLRSELAGLGLRVRYASHFAFEQNPFGWVQSILNGCGFKHNLLYDLLKNATARELQHPLRSHPFQSICSLLAFVLLTPLACLLLIPESLCRRGATMEIYAVRDET